MSTAVSNDFSALNSTAGSTTLTKNDAGSADRFLKLLVTQMQNQDPLNPMDNAQVTSQMAQINTVNGIENLNTTVQSLNTQFVQMQALQGAALVGHDITLQGNRLDINNAEGAGAFELASTADDVKVEVLSGGGHVLDTLKLGAQSAGRHAFTWPTNSANSSVADTSNLTFRVTATKGTQAINTTLLTRDQVQAVTTTAKGLVLQTEHSGDVAYSDVKAFN